jgi:cyclic pyranopterin phosphate synthase
MDHHLSHVRADGSAHMVDVTEKPTTARTARAQAVVQTHREVVEMIMGAGLPKGDALPVARVAGIMAAKKTWETIPLCHPIPLGKITVDFEADVEAGTVRVETLVKTTGVTGVEMEALSAASTAALTVYDMIKAVDARASITDVRVVEKAGGKSGDWSIDESGENS